MILPQAQRVVPHCLPRTAVALRQTATGAEWHAVACGSNPGRLRSVREPLRTRLTRGWLAR
jgi:hypothetical protein